MKRVLAILALVIFSGLILIPAASATNHKFPDCHGKNSVPCRPDPQPSHGKDCLKHGKGGVNEDHCLKGGTTPPPPPPTPKPHPKPKPGPQDCSHIECLGGGGPLAKTGTEPWRFALSGFGLLSAGVLIRRTPATR